MHAVIIAKLWLRIIKSIVIEKIQDINSNLSAPHGNPRSSHRAAKIQRCCHPTRSYLLASYHKARVKRVLAQLHAVKEATPVQNFRLELQSIKHPMKQEPSTQINLQKVCWRLQRAMPCLCKISSHERSQFSQSIKSQRHHLLSSSKRVSILQTVPSKHAHRTIAIYQAIMQQLGQKQKRAHRRQVETEHRNCKQQKLLPSWQRILEPWERALDSRR